MRGGGVPGTLRESEPVRNLRREGSHVRIPVDLRQHRRGRHGHRTQVRLHRASHSPRPPDVVVGSVEQHRVRLNRQGRQRCPRGPAQRHGHPGGVDLRVRGRRDRVSLDPRLQFGSHRRSFGGGQQLGIGQARRNIRVTRADNHRADRHWPGPRAAPHLVDARDACQPVRSHFPLDLIPRHATS
jgi:hypothetical protein